MFENLPAKIYRLVRDGGIVTAPPTGRRNS
jgi:hypothetical protein